MQSLLQRVDFDDGYSGRVVHAADDGGVGGGREEGDDGGFEVVRGRNRGGFDVGLLRVFPVVVPGARRKQFAQLSRPSS